MRAVRAAVAAPAARASCAALACFALLGPGCAYFSSSQGASRESRSAHPLEDDARLVCDGKPCSAAPLYRDVDGGHSKRTFFSVAGVELGVFLLGHYAAQAPSASYPLKGTFDSIGWLSLIGLLLDGAAGLYGVATDKFDPKTSPWFLEQHVDGEWRRLKPIPLSVKDLVPRGADVPPEQFSVEEVLKLRAIPVPPKVRDEQLLPDGGVVVVARLTAARDAGLTPENLATFTDQVRGAVKAAGDRIKVPTDQNLHATLKLSQAELESLYAIGDPLEMARRVPGSVAVVTGELAGLSIKLRLRDVQTGKELCAAEAAAQSLETLDDAVEQAARKLAEPLK